MHVLFETFLLVGEKHGTHCGCPPNTTLAKTGEISKLKQNLLEPKESKENNDHAAKSIPNLFTKKKALILLSVMNMDINNNSIAQLKKFTIEDISLVAQLIQWKKYDHLAKVYENIGKCVKVKCENVKMCNDPSGKYFFFY